VLNFNSQPLQLQLAQETDEIARQRYATTVEAFIAGKIEILNLNDSQASKDAAQSNYIRQLAALWSYYYQIRSLTLYDFLKGRSLDIPENLTP
jgi:outer membrane protein TolC